MKPKLITIDLDGTLLKNNCTISLSTQEALLSCISASSTLLIPCTGRSYQNSRFVLNSISDFPYYINANGTTITDGTSGKILYTHTFPLEIGRAIYSTAKEYRAFIEIYHGLTAYDSATGRKYLNQSPCSNDYITQLLYTNTHLENLDSFVCEAAHPISKFHIVCVSPQEKQELKERLAKIPDVFPISTTKFNIEICYKGWSKRDGLEKLCKILQVSPDDTAAIGDSENDYEMIRWAGQGIAMGNASQKIKDAADYITGSNEEDGIVQALNYLKML